MRSRFGAQHGPIGAASDTRKPPPQPQTPLPHQTAAFLSAPKRVFVPSTPQNAYPDGVKYVIVIPDGAADLPLPQLASDAPGCEAGRTPLEAARMPNTAAIAARGRVGVANTTPPGFEAGSDVCSMSLLGYDPSRYHTGRAPLEAAALGLDLTARDWIFRLNFVTVGAPGSPDEGLMLDHSAGALTDAEAKVLLTDLMDQWRQRVPHLVKHVALHPGVSYRNIFVESSGSDYRAVKCTPPHAIPREKWRDFLPQGGKEAAALCSLLDVAARFLPTHPINLSRAEHGLRPANMAWLWGQGTKPTVPSFQSRFGLKGAMITSVDLLRGIANYMGWDNLHVPGLTSYHDTDYAAQGRATLDALHRYDIVCCHVESPDEASHQADWQTKVASLESIDREIIGPIAKALGLDGESTSEFGEARLLMMPDHFTLCSTRKHDATPVPFLMAGTWVQSAVQRPFTEAAAAESDLRIAAGHDLMEYFLRGGLTGTSSARDGKGGRA